MTTPPESCTRRVIQATCALHRGPVGFTNLVMRKLDEGIELDPHADRCCVLVLDETAAAMLRDQLTEWLG